MRLPKLILSLLVVLLITGCGNKQEACPLESLLLDRHALPEGTTIDLSGPIRDEPKRSLIQSLYYKDALGINDIVDYPSRRRAKERYGQMQRTVFRNDLERGPWETPELNFTSTADEMHYGCGQALGGYACIYIGRFNTMVAGLTMYIGESGFSMNDFKAGMVQLEERILSCVEGNQ